MRTLASRSIITTCALLAAAAAWAGKPERDRLKELGGLMKKADKEVRRACGCSTAMKIDAQTFPNAGQMFRCHDTVAAIQQAAVTYCTDAETGKRDPENSKAYCGNVKSYRITHTTDRYAQPKLDSKVVQTWCNDMKYTNPDELADVLKAL